MTVALYAEFTARPGAEDAVAGLVSELTSRVREEPGNLTFAPSTLKDAPRRWFVYEVYRDAAAFQAHITADYGAVFNSSLGPLIEEDGSRLTWLSPAV
ncbi:MAG: putative quinol monooxygenase [Pseudolysinimonas sp.]